MEHRADVPLTISSGAANESRGRLDHEDSGLCVSPGRGKGSDLWNTQHWPWSTLLTPPSMSILSAHIVLWSPEQHAELKVPASQPAIPEMKTQNYFLLGAGFLLRYWNYLLFPGSPGTLKPSSVLFNVGVPEPGISLVVIRPRPEPCPPVFSS